MRLNLFLSLQTEAETAKMETTEETQTRPPLSIPEQKSFLAKHFDFLSAEQIDQLIALCEQVKIWNSKINLVSRKDIDHVFTHHLLHCLSIAKVMRFKPNSDVLDIGSGGGFPGLPLAIAFPDSWFKLIDSTQKKLTAVDGMIEALGIKNAQTIWGRVEEHRAQYDFVVGRAVTALPGFWKLAAPVIQTNSRNDLPNGVLYLKGGDFQEEIALTRAVHKLYKISNFFDDPYFDSKMVVYLKKN